MELVFFDVDGTLSVPTYIDKYGKKVVGFSDEEWLNYCKKTGEDGYKDCIVVAPVARYALKRKADGARLFVLSTAQLPEETAAKIKFVNDRFPGVFEEVITVAHDAQKLSVMSDKAKECNVDITDCEIVEDTYATILKANEMGIKATHISQIVCEL